MNSKTFLLTLLLLLSTLSSNAQQIVKSFEPLLFDIDGTNDAHMKHDANANIAAIIKVQTIDQKYTFNTGSIGVVATVMKSGETWVYVSPGIIKITVSHPDIGVHRNYEFPCEIEPGKVYEMKLYPHNVKHIIEEDAGGQYVVLNIKPQNCEVTIDNGEPEYITNGRSSKFLGYGSHKIKVAASMHKTYETQIEVGTTKLEKEISLEPQYAQLQINSNAHHAVVYIEGQEVGTTPKEIKKLRYGTHRVSVRQTGYLPFDTILTLNEHKQYNIHADLKENVGYLSVKCDSPDVDIYVDDKKMGTDNWRGKLSVGDHIVEARKNGHRTRKQSIEIKIDETNELQMESPTPMYGSINVPLSNETFSIYIDDKFVGESPMIIKDILAGERKLTFKKEGFQDKTAIVTVQEAKITDFTEDMILEAAKQNSVYFYANINADVYSKGEKVGTTNSEIKLPDGSHVLTITRDGYHDIVKSIYLSDEETFTQHVSLRSESSQHSSSLTTRSYTSTSSSSDVSSSSLANRRWNLLWDVTYSYKDMLGMRFAFCKKWGWAFHTQASMIDLNNEDKTTMRLTTGPMFRLHDNLFLSVCIGWGAYIYEDAIQEDDIQEDDIFGNIYDDDYFLTSSTSTNIKNAFEMEAIFTYKYKILAVSLGYSTNTHYIKTGGPLSIYGNVVAGIGIMF